MHEFGGLPAPFLEVDNGGCQWSTDTVPRVLLGLKLLKCLLPRLFKGWELIFWPCLDEVVNGLDVMNEDLVTGINVSFAVDIIGDIKQTSRVVAEVLRHGLA